MSTPQVTLWRQVIISLLVPTVLLRNSRNWLSAIKGQFLTIVLLYFDDMVIIGNNEKTIRDLKKFLNSCFKIKDLGPLKYFLGIEVTRSKAGITIFQRKYTMDLLEGTGLLGTKPTTVPMEPDLVWTETGNEALKDPTRYHRLVRKLIYLTISMLEITYSVITQKIHAGTPDTPSQGSSSTSSILEGSFRARFVVLIK